MDTHCLILMTVKMAITISPALEIKKDIPSDDIEDFDK